MQTSMLVSKPSIEGASEMVLIILINFVCLSHICSLVEVYHNNKGYYLLCLIIGAGLVIPGLSFLYHLSAGFFDEGLNLRDEVVSFILYCWSLSLLFYLLRSQIVTQEEVVPPEKDSQQPTLSDPNDLYIVKITTSDSTAAEDVSLYGDHCDVAEDSHIINSETESQIVIQKPEPLPVTFTPPVSKLSNLAVEESLSPIPPYIPEILSLHLASSEPVSLLIQRMSQKKAESRSMIIPSTIPLLAPSPSNKKYLVLDLDGTLILVQKDIPFPSYDFEFELLSPSRRFYVKKRPHLNVFLKAVQEHYELILWTASTDDYCNAIVHELDPNNSIFSAVLSRSACTKWYKLYVKDLSLLGRPLDKTLVLEDSYVSFLFHPYHAIYITTWDQNPNDIVLLDIVALLDALSRCTGSITPHLKRLVNSSFKRSLKSISIDQHCVKIGSLLSLSVA